jgi:hypothetical protein
VTPIFDLRQLGARSPGTCQVHRRSTAGPSRVHADSDPARLQPDAPRAGRGALHRGAGRQARTLRRTADRQHPLASPPPDPGSAATRCAADGSCLCVGQDEAIKDLPEGLQTRRQSSGRPAQPGGTSGSADRWSIPDAVRYMSVHSRKQPDSHGHSGTSMGPRQPHVRLAKPQATGRFRR